MALGLKLRDATMPPHLRRGNARKRCELCRHYGRGECMKYGYPVRPNELCDSFAAKAGGKERGK